MLRMELPAYRQAGALPSAGRFLLAKYLRRSFFILALKGKDSGREIIKYIALTLFIAILIFSKASFAIEPITADLIDKNDRILILSPHPDDEAIACSGFIQAALNKNIPVKIIYLTNGDHNEIAFIVYSKRLVFRSGAFIYMGELRRKEAIKAMVGLGLPEQNLTFLGYPDFGTFQMFTRLWNSPKAYKSMLTRIDKVPYKENYSYKSSYRPENILRDLEKLLDTYRPTKIFVSHPADTNGDHRAFNLFLSIALWNLEEKNLSPKVYYYLVHHTGWPLPRRYHPNLSLKVPEDLANTGKWFSFDLNQNMTAKKHQAILSYKSQTESSAFYLLSFARKNELFNELNTFNLKGQNEVALDGFARYMLRDNKLNIMLKHPDREHDIARAAIYLFGWRNDVSFADMPKIILSINSDQVMVFNGKKRLKAEGISQDISDNYMVIRIPLELLNNPHKALISSRIFSKKIPFTQGIWNRFEFSGPEHKQDQSN